MARWRALLMLVVGVGGMLTGAGTAVEATDATLYLTDATGEPGEQVRITLGVRNAESIAGYQANITYDPTVARLVRVNGSDFDAPVTNVNNDDGWVFLTQARSQGVTDPTLAVLVFNLTGARGDATALRFVAADTSVNRENGTRIGATLDGGRIGIGTEATVEPTTTEASPTPTGTTTQRSTTTSTTADPSTQTDDRTATARTATTTGGEPQTSNSVTPIEVGSTTTETPTTVPATTTPGGGVPIIPIVGGFGAVLLIALIIVVRRT